MWSKIVTQATILVSVLLFYIASISIIDYGEHFLKAYGK